MSDAVSPAHLRSVNGIGIGQKVRATELWIAKLTAGGAGAYAEPLRKGGAVVDIVAHPDGLWVTVFVRLDAPAPWMSEPFLGFWPQHLEPQGDQK